MEPATQKPPQSGPNRRKSTRPRPRFDMDDGPDLVSGYQPPRLVPLPLCIELPTSWYDDPSYQLSPFAYAGCTSPPPQFGIFGTCTRGNELLANSFTGAFAHLFVGTPGSGKSYIDGVYTECALIRNRYQCVLPKPLCVLSFGYGRHGGGSHLAEQLSARYPNQRPAEVRSLLYDHGTLPEGIQDVVGLTLAENVEAMRQQHPHVQLLALKVPCRQLGIDNLKKLMTMGERADTLVADEISDLVDTLPRDFTKQDLIDAAHRYRFRDRHMRRVVLKRLRMACKLIDDRADLRGLIRPGRLIVVDIRHMWLPWTKAMKLFQVVLDVLVMGGDAPCNLLLCVDEAHKFLENRGVRYQLEQIIKERRHLGISIVLSSQNPLGIPHSTLAELDGVGVFRTDSARVVRHLGRDFVVFQELSAWDTARLLDGEMFFWSQKWCVPGAPGSLDGYLLKVKVRPRMSHHGGATRLAL